MDGIRRPGSTEQAIHKFNDAPSAGGYRLEDVSSCTDVDQCTDQFGFAGMIRLVDDEEIGDFENPRLVHLDRIAHARHDDDRGGVHVFPYGNVTLPGSDGFDDDIIKSGATDELKHAPKRVIVFSDNSQTPVEDIFVNGIEVDAQSISEQSPA